MTGFLFYLTVDKLNNPRAMSLNFFSGKIQMKSKSFLKLKKRKRNYDFQVTSQTLRFCVIEWDWKLYILEYQNYCVKYLSTLVFKSLGENKNFEISILFSSYIQCLAFTVKLRYLRILRVLDEWTLSDWSSQERI